MQILFIIEQTAGRAGTLVIITTDVAVNSLNYDLDSLCVVQILYIIEQTAGRGNNELSKERDEGVAS